MTTSESNPSLSVVVPTFRRSESLVRALDALAGQDLPGIEIVVVDQNPEGFLAELLPPRLQDRIVRVVQEVPNVSSARNLGFVHSMGDLVLFLDDDLVPEPTFCRQGVELLARRPEIGCLVPHLTTARGAEADLFPYQRARLAVDPEDPDLWRITETISAAVLFRRNCYEQAGGFDEFLFEHARAGEDHELFVRMGKRGLTVWLHRLWTVFHDESVPGGAEMRTVPRIENRLRSIRSWTIVARSHSRHPPRLDVAGIVKLLHFGVFNRRTLTAGPREIWTNLRLVAECIAWSRKVMSRDEERRKTATAIDHVARYL